MLLLLLLLLYFLLRAFYFPLVLVSSFGLKMSNPEFCCKQACNLVWNVSAVTTHYSAPSPCLQHAVLLSPLLFSNKSLMESLFLCIPYISFLSDMICWSKSFWPTCVTMVTWWENSKSTKEKCEFHVQNPTTLD